MSDTNETATTTTEPARFRDGVEITRTDVNGRTIVMKRLSLWEEMELIAVAGAERAANQQWMVYATMAACIRSINGVPVPPIATREHLERNVKLVGGAGVGAVGLVLSEELDHPGAAEPAERIADVAKN